MTPGGTGENQSTAGQKRQILFYGYLALWVLTWVWGSIDADRHFHEMAAGRRGETTTFVPFQDLNEDWMPTRDVGFYRSKGIAVSPLPFILFFPASYQSSPLEGFAGIFVDFWFFGFHKCFTVYRKWVS